MWRNLSYGYDYIKKMFMPLAWDSSPSLIICIFGLFTVSQRFCMFYSYAFFNLSLSLTKWPDFLYLVMKPWYSVLLMSFWIVLLKFSFPVSFSVLFLFRFQSLHWIPFTSLIDFLISFSWLYFSWKQICLWIHSHIYFHVLSEIVERI